MKLWHDDIRRPPDDSWFWARTNREAMWFLLDQWMEGKAVTEASLDHDMGLEAEDPDADPMSWKLRGASPEGDGRDLCYSMYYLRLVPPIVTIHSWNDAGAQHMAAILREAGSDVTVKPYAPPTMDELTYKAMFHEWPA